MFRLWTYVTYVFNILVCFAVAAGMFYALVLKEVPDPNDNYGLLFGGLVFFASMTNAYHNFLYLFRDQSYYPEDSLFSQSRAERAQAQRARPERLADDRRMRRP